MNANLKRKLDLKVVKITKAEKQRSKIHDIQKCKMQRRGSLSEEKIGNHTFWIKLQTS